MADFDVFNGDADGLCALHQLRLLEPREATLVTGPKRDIALLQRVSLESPPSAGPAPPPSAGQAPPPSAGERAPDRASEMTSARITVLDISLDRNRQPLLALTSPLPLPAPTPKSSAPASSAPHSASRRP